MERDPKERDARRLIEAAAILEGQMVGDDTASEEGPRRNELGFGPERDALLLIAGAMANRLLELIDDTREILAWDESLNLVSNEKKMQPDIIDGMDELIESDLEEDFDGLPDLEISEDRAQARNLILTDGSVEPSELYVSEIVHPEESWLVPVMASTPCKKGNPIGFNSWRQAQFYGSKGFDHLEKPEDDIEKIDGVIDTGLIEELNRHDLGGRQGEWPERGLEDAGPDFREAVPEITEPASKYGSGLFSQEKAIMLIKAMSILVIILLAVEAVLYLI
jgi:hypothetical protein